VIGRDREAEILRLHHAEQWKPGTIAAQLGHHHSTIRRVLAQAGLQDGLISARPSMVDPYIPFIIETLGKYPRLRASRLHAMVKARGYPGAPDHFRTIVARYRPRPPAEAFLRLRTLPGEQGQVDWGHFGKVTIGQASRSLFAFVMVLSWSRQIFLRFYLRAAMPSFLRGHVEAFDFFGGVPRVLLYDNIKSAVLERAGSAIRFHSTLLDLAAHYHYLPRPVAPARGNEKGRVERAIRYVRDNFFAARSFVDVADLNAQALAWMTGPAADRRCPGYSTRTVRRMLRRRTGQAARAASRSLSSGRTRRGQRGQDPLRSFRSQRLLDPLHPHPAHACGPRFDRDRPDPRGQR
jgi:transposase